MPGTAVNLRCLVASATTLALGAVLATMAVAPAAHAADGRELLANAIANTRGSYLVYNFGGNNPAPMLNADGSWYQMGGGGHLMIIKSASQRLTPRLLVDSHRGYQARCESTPGARTSEGLLQGAETFTPIQAWQALGKPTIAINATSSTCAPSWVAPGSRRVVARPWARTSTTRGVEARPMRW